MDEKQTFLLIYLIIAIVTMLYIYLRTTYEYYIVQKLREESGVDIHNSYSHVDTSNYRYYSFYHGAEIFTMMAGVLFPFLILWKVNDLFQSFIKYFAHKSVNRLLSESNKDLESFDNFNNTEE